jgi:hypothetical protein
MNLTDDAHRTLVREENSHSPDSVSGGPLMYQTDSELIAIVCLASVPATLNIANRRLSMLAAPLCLLDRAGSVDEVRASMSRTFTAPN